MESTGKVRVEREGDVAVLVIDNPPVNAGSAAVRRGLLAGLLEAQSGKDVRAVVLLGAGTTFIAGADLREFGRPLEEPQLPDVIAAIEACDKPVVAALHGAALGGGFELALGCDARVASPGTVVGLPEVTLGIVPGAGGTQRLPRIVGLADAIRWICSGERLPLAKALGAGLVDREIEGDLRLGAVQYARAITGKRRVRDFPLPPSDPATVEAVAAASLKAGRNRPAVKEAIARTLAAATLPFDAALEQERAAFQALRLSREAYALRHQFFAERDSAKHPSLAGAKARDVSRVAVIGAGTMGSGIAIAALEAGYEVTLLEQDAEALGRGLARIRAHYAGRIEAGKASEATAALSLSRLRSGVDWAALSTADLVIEAVFEDLAVKQEVFRRIDGLARPGAVLASNTSYLDLDAIASATSRPGDVVGLHFFSPANVMRLVEVVRGEATGEDVLATALAVGRRLKKLPVLARNAFGFIGNRLYAAYRRQAEFMIEEGAWPHQVDAALEAFGFAMGPFAVADLSGLDIAWRMRQAQSASRDPDARYVGIPDRLCEAGRLGRKAGAGYYRYPPGVKERQVDEAVHAIISHASAGKGLVRREIPEEVIQRRALLALVNEAALLLAEGVAANATDIDVVLANGYGFPRWEGGPVFWARERSDKELRADIDWLASVSGPGFVRGDVSFLLPGQS